MRRVLHVGPCNTPGGMATVMTTLADHPPDGWEASLLASHSEGGILGKWAAYRRARRELNRRCTDASQRPDVVHVHVASDWSWRRKARLIAVARRHGVPVVVHLHSGRFEAWLEAGGPRRSGVVKKALNSPRVEGVVLSEAWRARLEGQDVPRIQLEVARAAQRL